MHCIQGDSTQFMMSTLLMELGSNLFGEWRTRRLCILTKNLDARKLSSMHYTYYTCEPLALHFELESGTFSCAFCNSDLVHINYNFQAHRTKGREIKRTIPIRLLHALLPEKNTLALYCNFILAPYFFLAFISTKRSKSR